tara:strand:+ start:6059 stop:6646 length:588 start_codon:yes stop_codon:yes gene_type:complete
MNNETNITITESEDTSDLVEDAEATVVQNDLAEIRQLGDTLNNLDQEILRIEAETSNLKQKRKQVAEELIPDLMNKCGLSLIQLSNGSKIQIKEFVDARIKDPNVAFEWLRETNNDSIIKNEITISLNKGEDETARNILATLKETFDVDAGLKIGVHNMTLKSFCKDALANPELAESLPREAFGIYEGQRAKITN